MNYFEMANEEYMNKNYEMAITLYHKAAATVSNEASCLYNSAVCHIKLNRFNEAIQLLKNALLKRKDSKYYFNLAYCFYMLNDYKRSLIYFNIAWSVDNEDEDCKKAINCILLKLQNKR